MFTDTLTAPTLAAYNPTYNTTPFFANPNQIAIELYNQYRNLALCLINVQNPSLQYRALSNSAGSVNGYGLHEKFIHNSRSVVDVSIGALDFPWSAADADQRNMVSAQTLYDVASTQSNALVAGRLRTIGDFISTLPPYTGVYLYVGNDGVIAVTISDDMNNVKFNMIVSHMYV